MLIDSHAHLDFPEFDKDLEDVLLRARDAGVKYIINIGTDLKASQRVVALAEKYDHLFAAVGIHPHEATNVKESDYVELEKLANHPKVIGIGEIGLDYYKDRSPRENQKDIFIRQLHLVRDVNKPVIIHSREAHKDCLEIIRKEMGSKVTGVAHCFSGSIEDARQYLNLGFYISIGGPITYPNAAKLRNTAKTIPIERLLLETDCPFLAPQQRRGLRNEPSYLVYCVEEFAGIYGLSTNDIARITSHNAIQLFGLGKPAEKGKIAYNIRDALYLNITNRCTSDCVFCVTKITDYVKGHNLRLAHEPTLEEIIKAIEESVKYKEVVFCGYGEPTLRLDVLKEIASYLKGKNIKVRLNTNGHGNLIYNRSILPELKGLIDVVSVSLNGATAEEYFKTCHPKFGKTTFDKVLEFIKEAKQYIPKVEITSVTYPDNAIDKYEEIARQLGVDFRARIYNEVG